MIKLALITLILALLAAALGLPGVSEFALTLSKVLFSVVGLVVVMTGLFIFFGYRWFRREQKMYRA